MYLARFCPRVQALTGFSASTVPAALQRQVLADQFDLALLIVLLADYSLQPMCISSRGRPALLTSMLGMTGPHTYALHPCLG